MEAQLERLKTALEDRYFVERELGQGGMATVYLARDLKHERLVALKVLHPDLAAVLGAERFIAEIKTTAHLQHPNILQLFDSGGADGFLYYVMPFVEGESLRSRLTREKQLPIDEAITIARATAAALDYAHRHGVIHRDIKPENILLQDGQPLVADFGIALAVTAAGGVRLTQTGLSLGTPQYMSPEQATGERDIDIRSDIYALGAVTYEMVAGEPPFTGNTTQAIIAKLLTEQPRRLSALRKMVPASVEAAVHRAMEKLPADRFATAAQFAEALTRSTSTTASDGATTQASGSRREVDWRLLAIGAAAGVVIGAAAVRVMAPPAAPPEPMTRSSLSIAPATALGSGFAQQVALSPDGSAIAFVAYGMRGVQVFARGLSDSVAHPLAGTEGSYVPFFSPDGRRIGFWSPQQLRWISPEGGSPTLITDSAGPVAAWTDHNEVVYVDPTARSLRLVQANGARREIVRVDSGQFIALSGLPGGRAVLAALLSSSTGGTRVVAVSLKDGVMRDIGLPDAVMARYVSSGHIIYEQSSGGPLMSADFDLGSQHVRGEGRPVAPEPRVTYRVVEQWDAAGSSIVYVPQAPFQLVETDRTGRTTVLQEQPRVYHHPRVSPDGRRVVLDIADAQSRDVWIMDMRDRGLTRLTVGETANDPYWSPDGRRIAYTSRRGAGRAIFTRNADGSGQADSIYADGRDHSSGTWSPDGRTIVATTNLTGGLWAISLDSVVRAALVPGSRLTEAHPAFSPDGRWLAYISDESGREEVYVRPFPGPGGRIAVSLSGGSEPVWTRDGRELIYREDTGLGNRLIAASVRLSPTFEVTSRAFLFDMSAYVTDVSHANYDVAPDGRSFVMIRSSQPTAIQVIQHWTAQLRKP